MNYVTGYTQYSTTAAEQSGNYIALDIDATDDSSVTVEFIDSDLTTQADAVTFTDKASMVFRITDVDKQSLKITAHRSEERRVGKEC